MNQLLTSPVNTIALAKCLRDDDVKDARAALSAGDYVIDSTLRLKGTMSIGLDYTSRIVMKANPWALLALAMNKLNGVSIEALVKEALQREAVLTPSGEIVKTQVDKAIEKIKGRTAQRCRGRVSPRIVVELARDLSVLRKKREPEAEREAA